MTLYNRSFLAISLFSLASAAHAQDHAALQGSIPPQAQLQNNAGELDPSTRVEDMLIELTKSAAQEADFQKLLADQRYKHPSYWAPYLLIGNWL